MSLIADGADPTCKRIAVRGCAEHLRSASADQVMTCEPYASADRVFWVVDNGSSHRGQAAIDRLTARYPNAVMVHTPVHASWLNQVEIYFSIVQRKVLTPNDFPDLTVVEDRLHAFAERYNRRRHRARRKPAHPVQRRPNVGRGTPRSDRSASYAPPNRSPGGTTAAISTAN